MNHSKAYGIFLLVTTALVFSLAIFHGLSVPQGINADALYPLTFVGDLARHEPILWSVPAANFFFPDVFVAGIGYAAGLRGFDNIVLYYATVCAAIFITGYAFLRSAGIGGLPSIVAALLAVSVVAFFDGSMTLLTHTFIVPAHHGGVVALQLAAAALFVAYVSRPDTRIGIFFAIVVAVAVFSDRITTAQFVIPAFVALAWLARSDRKVDVRALSLFLFAGTAVAWAAVGLLDHSPWIHHSDIIPLWDGGVLLLLHRVRISLLQIPRITGVADAIVLGGSYVALVFLAIVAVRGKGGRFSLLVVLAALLSTASLLTPIVGGLWTDPVGIRYQLPFFVIPLLTVAGLLLDAFAPPRRVLWAASAIVLLAALTLAVSVPTMHGAKSADVNAFAEFTGLTARLAGATSPVFAQYWLAKPLLYLSGDQLRVCGVTDKGQVDPFIGNLSWCIDALRALSSPPQPFVAFIDYEGSFKQPDFQNELGPPAGADTVAGFRVTYYRSSVVREKMQVSLCGALRAFGRPDAMDECRHQD
ncbi:MAG TPA: hypothetical protein VN905_05925 [Candidatus Binatia bacterium]|nr:hypothetical protein [Candidatus Binatia bacterium]